MELVTTRADGVTTETLTILGEKDYYDHEEAFLTMMEGLADNASDQDVVKVEFAISYREAKR